MKKQESFPGIHAGLNEPQEGYHRPLSPATPAESFFLPKFQSTNISAFALAANLRESTNQKNEKRSANLSVASATTDDYLSCAEPDSEDLKHFDFGTPIKEIEREEVFLDSSDKIHTEIMSDFDKKEIETIPETGAPENLNQIDPSQNIYGGLKNVWGFGTSFVLTKPFAKATETVAGKILSITTGMEFAGVDDEIKPKLAELDNHILNPTISHIVGMVEPIVKKAHAVIHPVAETVLGRIGLMDKKALESDETEDSAPEMTGAAVVN